MNQILFQELRRQPSARSNPPPERVKQARHGHGVRQRLLVRPWQGSRPRIHAGWDGTSEFFQVLKVTD